MKSGIILPAAQKKEEGISDGEREGKKERKRGLLLEAKGDISLHRIAPASEGRSFPTRSGGEEDP